MSYPSPALSAASSSRLDTSLIDTPRTAGSSHNSPSENRQQRPTTRGPSNRRMMRPRTTELEATWNTVLTESPVEESSFTEDLEVNRLWSMRERPSGETLQRLNQYEAARRSATSSSGSNGASGSLPYLNSPVSPPRQHLLPRRPLIDTQFARRRDLSDDPNTFIGRHVAAREASANPPPPSISPDSRQNTSHLQREMELFRTMINIRQRRSEPGVTVARSQSLDQHIPEQERPIRSLDVNIIRGTGARNTQLPPLLSPLPPPTRRPRMLTQNSTSSTASANGPESRLSLLSNFSVQNFASPSSAVARDRPLIFEEPTSYLNPSMEDNLSNQNRSYTIRRTINSDGEEVVHTINITGEELDPLGWVNNVQDAVLDRDQSINLGPALSRRREELLAPRSDSYPSRMQSWLPLDLDGDEIHPDDDPDFEPSDQAHFEWARSQLLMPRSGNSFPLELDAEPPRVRLSPRRPRYETDEDGAAYGYVPPRPFRRPRGKSIPEIFGSTIPFRPDPLPTPLSHMVPSSSYDIEQEGIKIARSACLAGR